MDIIVPPKFAFAVDPIIVQVDDKTMKFPFGSGYEEYGAFTICALGAKFGKRDLTCKEVVYKIKPSFISQLAVTITKMYRSSEYSEIVSAWFRYQLLYFTISGQSGKLISVTPGSSNFIQHDRLIPLPHWSTRDKVLTYSCSIDLYPPRSGWNVMSPFWVSSQSLHTCQLDLPLSTLLKSDEYLNLGKDWKSDYLYNAFRFYLWCKPSLIDVLPNFNVVYCNKEDSFPCFRMEWDFLKELIKITLNSKKVLFLAAGILAFPELFA